MCRWERWSSDSIERHDLCALVAASGARVSVLGKRYIYSVYQLYQKLCFDKSVVCLNEERFVLFAE